MKRRGFLAALASFVATPAIARVVQLVPVAGPKLVTWSVEFNQALKRYYDEVYYDLSCRDHVLMGLVSKRDTVD